MLSVYKREMQRYFYTPLGYVLLGVFLLLAGIFFMTGTSSL